MVAPGDEVLATIKAFANPVQAPFDHDVEVRFFTAAPTRALYPLMKAPPVNVAFLAGTDLVSISKVGFVGELVVLLAQSLGLATCWYGHYKLAELERVMPHLQSADQLDEANMGYGYSPGVTSGRRAICITPLGYHDGGGLRLMDRMTRALFSFKRREIADLLDDPADLERLPGDVVHALDMGRKAPSAANAQMWRFSFEDEYRTIVVSMPAGYKHFKWEHPSVDIGICASHVWLGLLDRGHEPAVSVHEADGVVSWRLSIGARA